MIAVCLAMIDDAEEKIKFENLVKAYEKKLYKTAFAIVRQHELAEDAVWTAFFHIAANFSKLKKLPKIQLEAYLQITAKTSAIGILKHEKEHIENEIDIDILNLPAQENFNNFDVNDIRRAIRNLDEKYKTVIIYYYFYGNSASEIAKIMGVSRKTVYNYLKKANEKIKNFLGGKKHGTKNSTAPSYI